MKKRLKSIISIFGVALMLGSCASPDKINMDLNENNTGISSIKVTFKDGKGTFAPEQVGPYHDGAVINVAVPWFFPEDSNNETTITDMRIYASLPNGVVVEPALTSIDLTKDNVYTITDPNGKRSTVTIKGYRKKSSDKLIENFSLVVNKDPKRTVQGIILQDKKMIGIYPDGNNIANVTAEFKLSPHATITPDPTAPMDYSQPITFTVTAFDGTTATYITDPTFVPTRLPHGMRKESVRQIWNKSLGDMGADPSGHMSTSIALTSKYLLINTRNQDMRYFDRFTGAYVGTVVLPFKASLANFFATSDDNNNILITNYKNGAGGNQTIYRIKDVTGTPEKYIDVAHGYIAGRKLSVRGSLDGNAVIMTTIEKSRDVLYWEVKGGVLVSQTPGKISLDASIPAWTFLADAISVDPTLSSGLFMSGYPSKFGFFFGNGSVGGLYDMEGAGFNGNFCGSAIDVVVFNNDRYIGQAINNMYGATQAAVYDVTTPANLGLKWNDDRLLMFRNNNVLSPNTNTNLTGDALLKVSDDGLKMVFYVMATNGGVAAFEFDCLDIPK